MSLALASAERVGLAARGRTAWQAVLARQHGRFAPWLAVALCAGVLAWFALPADPPPGAMAAALPAALAALAVAAVLARQAPAPGWGLGLAAAGLLGFALAGWHAARQPPFAELPATAVLLAGRVAQVEALPDGRRVTLEAARIAGGAPMERRLRVRLRANDPARPEPGDMLAVRALLRPPGGPVVPGAWDFARAAWFDGAGGSGFALGPAEVTPGEGGAPFAALRATLDARIAGAIPGAAGAVAAALVTGSQAGIAPEAMAAMRDSGLAHLLSVSGLHMAVVIGAVFATLRLALALVPWVALRVPAKPVAACAALAAGAAYMLLTGSQVPMQRCLAMAALVTLALLAGRRALTVRGIALAAALVVAIAPAELLGPSFQMSFGAVLALAAGWEVLRPRLAGIWPHGGWRRRVTLAVVGLALTSALAGAATAPAGLHHFGRLQVYGVLANAVAVPLTSFVVMPAGMLALAAMPFGLDAPALWLMGQGVEGVLAVARLVAGWPGAAPVLPPLPGAALAAAGLGFCWLGLWRGAVRLVGLPVVAGALAWGLVQPPPHLLVTADGRLVAFRTAEGVFLAAQPGATAFARAAVLRRMGAVVARPLPDTAEAAGATLACTAAACRFRPHPDGPEAVLLRTAPPARGARRGPTPDAAARHAACGQAVLVLATEPLRGNCDGSAVVDRFTLWREGAQAVWLDPAGLRRETGRAVRGERPWVPPPPLPGRPETLPLAPLDAGGPPLQ